MIIPDLSRTANRPAISLPRAEEAIKIDSAPSFSIICAIAAVAAAMPWRLISSFSTIRTRSNSVPFNWAANESPEPELASKRPIAFPARLAKVASSAADLATLLPS